MKGNRTFHPKGPRYKNGILSVYMTKKRIKEKIISDRKDKEEHLKGFTWDNQDEII